MGERRSVALLKELLNLNRACLSINISPLRGFSDRLLQIVIYDYYAPSFLSTSAAFEFPGFIFNDFL